MASIVVGDAVSVSQEQGTARARAVSAIQRQGALIALVALVIFGVVRYGSSFYSVYNIFDAFLNNNTYYALIALGMTFVIISGGIDLSVGSIVALSGVALGAMLQGGQPIPIAIAGSVAVGVLCGFVNGLLISIGRLPAFIATLGMMSVARGAALLFTEGRPVSGFDESFRWIATGSAAFIPAPVVAMIVIYAVAHLVLTRTTFGRYVYAIGGNEEATRLSGVSIPFHKTAIYCVSGLMSAAAAIVLTARLNSAQPIAGMMYELDAIAATVIGGTSLMGGEGSLGGTLVGALIMGVLRNGLNLLGVSSFLQQIVIGGVIVGAVLVDTILKRSRA
ncbi:MAG TPA: ABC transporter permease [Vicinamibacterales bacterium]|nr:ABC transporter permease [Vicinamibacterales bacterium]